MGSFFTSAKNCSHATLQQLLLARSARAMRAARHGAQPCLLEQLAACWELAMDCASRQAAARTERSPQLAMKVLLPEQLQGSYRGITCSNCEKPQCLYVPCRCRTMRTLYWGAPVIDRPLRAFRNQTARCPASIWTRMKDSFLHHQIALWLSPDWALFIIISLESTCDCQI